MARIAAVFVSVVLGSTMMPAQVGRGTLIIVQVLKDRIVMAGDSRTSHSCIPYCAPPEDDHCKVASFRNRFIFAVSGAVNSHDDAKFSWDSIEEAKRAANDVDASAGSAGKDSRKAVLEVADDWAKRMKADWTSLYARRPDWVTPIGRILTTGYFGAAANGTIALSVKNIVFENGEMKDETASDECSIAACTSMEVDHGIIASAEHAAISGPDFPEREILKIVKEIELVIQAAPAGHIGGPVDALELFPVNGVKWFRRKPNCSEDN